MTVLAEYKADNGNEIKLTDQTIRNYLCDNPAVTDKEVMLFAALCKGQNLDPFNRDAYLVKYKDSPAQIITSQDVFVKRAQRNPKFRGFQAGVTVIDPSGQLVQREGSLVVQGDVLVGGWCKVYVEGYEHPMYDEVSFDEYSTGRSMWRPAPLGKPATMIRKVAKAHALREAFPSDFQGLYCQEEMGVDEAIPKAPVVDPGNMEPETYEEPAQQGEQPFVPQAVDMGGIRFEEVI